MFLILCVLLVVLAPCVATGPRTTIASQEYLLHRTKSSSSAIEGINPSFDCGWRKSAYKYGKHLQSALTSAQNLALFDALELQTLCKLAPPPAAASKAETKVINPDDVDAIFVDSSNGKDTNEGTFQRPVRSIPVGLDRARTTGSTTIWLRAGTYYLREALVLTEEDSNLFIAAYNGEKAVLSGGRVLDNLIWKAASTTTTTSSPTSSSSTTFTAELQHVVDLASIPALQINGSRATLARFPNANPERDLFPVGYVTKATTWSPPLDHGKICNPNMQCGVSENVTTPVNDAWHGMYQNYEVGVGGACTRYTPPHSPWCSGNFYLKRQFPEMHTRSPSGLTAPSIARMEKYENPQGAVVHAWRPGHWYTWMFEVDSSTPGKNVPTWTTYDNVNAISGDVPSPGSSTSSVKFVGNFSTAEQCAAACRSNYSAWTWHSPHFDNAQWATGCYGRVDGVWSPVPQQDVFSGRAPHQDGTTFHFGAGGHQGGEGSDDAGEWFIENVREELDAPNEFFYDAMNQQLLYIPNSSNASGSTVARDLEQSVVVVPSIANFIELRGASSNDPVRNVTIKGLEFRSSRPTFMDPRGNPSGGDWALERMGAVYCENAEGIRIEGNLFTVSINVLMVVLIVVRNIYCDYYFDHRHYCYIVVMIIIFIVVVVIDIYYYDLSYYYYRCCCCCDRRR